MLVGGDQALETAKFTAIFDKFFDLLNVGCFEAGTKSNKGFKHPYRGPNDFRLAVCIQLAIATWDSF